MSRTSSSSVALPPENLAPEKLSPESQRAEASGAVSLPAETPKASAQKRGTATRTGLRESVLGASTALPRSWRRLAIWLLGLGFATCLAALSASQTYLSMLDHGHSWPRLFLWQWLYWSFWAALSPWVLASGARLVDPTRGRRSLFAVHAATALGIAIAHGLLAAALTLAIQPYLPVSNYSLGQAIGRGMNPWIFVDLIVYGMLVAAGYGAASYSHARRLELRESVLEAELTRARLDALRLEIQPHFLFNTLNSIASLVRRGSGPQAVEMIVGLSELLRRTLEHRDRHWVTLDEELSFLDRYVELQRARFRDRLTVLRSVPMELVDAPVPFLILQPLVENSIRHAVESRSTATTIEIRAAREGNLLALSVCDDGPGLGPDFDLEDSEGVGLRNVAGRLERLYGGCVVAMGPVVRDERRTGARLILESGKTGGLRCTLLLPEPPDETDLASTAA